MFSYDLFAIRVATGLQHSMTSTFYNEMFAFDMERKKWYQLGLKPPKTSVKVVKGVKKGGMESKGGGEHPLVASIEGVDDENSGEEDDGEVGDGDEEEDGDGKGDREMFGYIDEDGNVVYLDLLTEEKDMDGAEDEVEATNISESVAVVTVGEIIVGGEVGRNLSKITTVNVASAEDISQSPAPTVSCFKSPPLPCTNPPLPPAVTSNISTPLASSTRPPIPLSTPLPPSKPVSPTVTSYFVHRKEPCPRINPCLALKGHTLFVYGGVTELGDVEVTLDDCW